MYPEVDTLLKSLAEAGIGIFRLQACGLREEAKETRRHGRGFDTFMGL